MPLTLTIHTDSAIPLEADTLRMERLRTLSNAEIAATRILRGNQELPLGEFFRVSGSAADDETVVWDGDCRAVKGIGTKLAAGTMRIEGNAGMHLGAGMRGGEILCTGDAGDWAGAEMRGGRLRVQGNAGNLVGAVYRGGRKGMTGGEILIDGDAGHEIGHTMRRGLIAIGGTIGDFAGFGMIAGTIMAFGPCGRRHGAGMKRGTICLLDRNTVPELLPTFQFTSVIRPLFLEIYFRHLRALGFPLPSGGLIENCNVYRGDFLELGKGEILTHAV